MLVGLVLDEPTLLAINCESISLLKVLGSVGEPINPEAWQWYHRVVGGGKCAIVDTYWQSETGGHALTPLPGCTPLKPGSAVSTHVSLVSSVLMNT